MDDETFARVVRADFRIAPQIEADAATCSGSRISLHGAATVTASEDSIDLTLNDDSGWAMKMMMSEPTGMVDLTAGGFFRRSIPGALIESESGHMIKSDSGHWAARVTNISSGTEASTGRDRYGFKVWELEFAGPAVGQPIAASRHIFQGGAWNTASTLESRRFAVRALREGDKPHDEILAATVDGALDEIATEALWVAMSLITGNRLSGLAVEHFNESGALVCVTHRRGSGLSVGRGSLFHWDRAPLRSDGLRMLVEGVLRLMRTTPSFPIAMIVHHFLDANSGIVEVDAQHRVLAIHAAIEAWNRRYGPQSWIDDELWRPFADESKKGIFKPIADTVGSEMRKNLYSAYRFANRTQTADRQQWLIDALEITTNQDDKRALDLRNELLHNGFFLRRFSELNHAERQQRVDDTARLRRIAATIILKLTGFSGVFLDVMRYTAVQVQPVLLPADIAPPN